MNVLAVATDRHTGPPTPQNRPQARYLVQAIRLEEASPQGTLSLVVVVVCLLLVGAVGWAAVTPVDEVARAAGEVVPQGQVRTVAHLDGGVIEAIEVREGDLVVAGDVLVRLVPTINQAELEERRTQIAALLLQAERLRAFVEDRDPDFDAVVEGHPLLKAEQQAALEAQRESLRLQRVILESQIVQTRNEVELLNNQVDSIDEEIKFVTEEIGLRKELVDRGLSSRLEYIDAQRRRASLQRELSEVRDNRTRTRNALIEAGTRLEELEARLKNEARDEISTSIGTAAQVQEQLAALRFDLDRTVVTAPVDGYVQGMSIDSDQGIITPGQVLLQIVPRDGDLEVEAKVNPSDRGHIAIGDPVEVRVGSYDFAKYGSVPARVTRLSPTTFVDEDQQPYYRATIEFDANEVDPAAPFVGTPQNRIYAGMVVEAVIKTDQKTILEYIMRPVSRGFADAFTER